MKNSKVLPIFKKGKKDDMSKYRPISLLPQVSKILEKLLTRRLNSFLTKYGVISNSQCDF